MPYHDLNVPWAQDEADLHRSLTLLHELGYSVVALNHTITGKLPGQATSPIPATLPFNVPPRMRVLRRCTLLVDELPANTRLAALAAQFDILALRPTTERALAAAAACAHCDLISLDLTQRFEAFFKRKTLALAVANSVMLEICYGPAILAADPAPRRTLLSNAAQLIRASRGRGIVLSSAAPRPAACRGPADVVNLAAVWGLGQERGNEAVGATARAVVVAAAMRRSSWRGVVDVVHGGDGQRGAAAAAEKSGQNKRKADALGGEAVVAKGQPNPMSKTQQKKQRKLQAQQQAAERARSNQDQQQQSK